MWGDREDLRGDEGGGTTIKVYRIKFYFKTKKPDNKKHQIGRKEGRIKSQ